MKADQGIYDFMYARMPVIVKNKEALKIATRIATVYTECVRQKDR